MLDVLVVEALRAIPDQDVQRLQKFFTWCSMGTLNQELCTMISPYRRMQEGVIVSPKTKSVIDRAKRLYSEKLQRQLEAQHTDQFVAIEPGSGDHFIADTFDAAAKAARNAYPTRISFTMRIGQGAAFHIGVMQT